MGSNDDLAAAAMKVLAVGAHPLDVLLLAGGTLARYAAAGHRVTLVEVCVPRLDREDGPIEQALRKREAESRRAAGLIGAEAHLLRLANCAADVNDQARQRLADLIREAQPTVIMTHDPAGYCDCHTRTSALVQECEVLARQPDPSRSYPPLAEAAELVYMDTMAGLSFEPEEFVDITAVFDLKCRLLACHEEETAAWEISSSIPTDELAGVQNRYRGIQSGVRYAEAFRRARTWGHVRPRRILP